MLINCPECDHQVSNTIKSCPNCGYRLKKDSVLPLILILGGLGATVLAGLWFALMLPIASDSAKIGGMDFTPQTDMPNPDPVASPQWLPPEGFYLAQTKSLYGEPKRVATRWVPSADVQCASYMREGCYQLEVVSEKGCDSLYVSLVQLDSAGTNIGYTNDTTNSLAPGQIARLSFSSRGENKVQIGEISCH